MTREGAVMLTGTILYKFGLAISSFAAGKGYVYLASELLADGLVWGPGNPYTFRFRASNYLQAAMLAEAATKTDAVKHAIIAPNYAYGKIAVAALISALSALRPDVEFVAEQEPGVFKIDAGAEVRALERANPDAIYNVTFGSDLVSEQNLHFAQLVGERVVIIDSGKQKYYGILDELNCQPELRNAYLVA